MSKPAVLLLILLLTASSFLLTKPVNAAPKPDAPEFTVNVIDDSYDVAPTTSVDAYTGGTSTIQGRHVTAYHVDLSIKNQLFNYSLGNTIYYLRYTVEVKGHFEDHWTQIYPSSQYLGASLRSSDSQTTNITYTSDFSPGAQIDFRVQAESYYYTTVEVPKYPMLGPQYANATKPVDVIEVDKTSDWSPTQTAKIPDKNANNASIQGGVLFGLDWQQVAIALFIVVVVLATALTVLAFKKRKCANGKLSEVRLRMFLEP
jgi:hypothetical protein